MLQDFHHEPLHACESLRFRLLYVSGTKTVRLNDDPCCGTHLPHRRDVQRPDIDSPLESLRLGDMSAALGNWRRAFRAE